jgi:hypothetical protein
MKPVQLFGSGVAGKSLPVTAQRRVNCYYEVKQDGDKQGVVVYGTPGLSIFSDQSSANGAVRGMHNFISKNLLFCIVNNLLFEINAAGAATNRGSITPGTGIVAMEDNGRQLIILDGTQGWIYTPATTTLAAITDANFPQNATTVCFDSGFFLVDSPSVNGQFQKSKSYDGTIWDPTDLGIMYSNAGQLVALYALAGVVIVGGQQVIEFWVNQGTLGFPYAPNKSATQPYGIAAKRSIAPLDNTVAFLAQNQTGRLSIMMLNGYTASRISTPDIDNIINGFSITSDAVAFGYVIDGHPMYQITFQNAKRTFLFDLSTVLWSEIQSGVGLTGRHLCNLGVGFNGAFYCGDASVGRVYLLDPNSYTDNGTTIPRELQSRHIFDSYDTLGVDELYIDLETGVGLQSGQGSNPQMMLQVSKDQGRTFGNERWVQMGRVGQYKDHRAVWRRLGSGRDFVFRFTVTDPVKFAVVGGAALLRVGTDNERNNRGS